MTDVTTAAGDIPATGSMTPRAAMARGEHALRGVAPMLRWRQVLFVLAAWTIVGLFNTEQTYVALLTHGRHFPWFSLLQALMPGMVMWALLTPLVVMLTRRLPIDRHTWPRVVPVHIVAAMLTSLADATLYSFIDPWVNPTPAPSILAGFVRYLNVNLVNYFLVVSITLFIDYSKLLRERQMAAAELSSRLTAAHLKALQAQLRPHFLFNTLNTVAELVHQDAEAADRMITQLAALLRRSLDSFGDQEIPLRTELEFLNDYVEIIKVRFKGRISVTTRIEAAALPANVPTLVLQPIVENAVRHGLEPKAAGGRVEVTAWVDGTRLKIDVRDDGVGVSCFGSVNTIVSGVGLQNTEDRLRHLYGLAATLNVLPREGGGTIVSIVMPFRNAQVLTENGE